MVSLLIFYFFILISFFKSINIDNRLVILFIFFGIYYIYIQSKKEKVEIKLDNSNKNIDIYSYGNKEKKFDNLDDKNIGEIKDLKEIIYSMDIHNNDKIEIYSAIKKYFHIFHNLDKYDYKHNWVNDLNYNETNIYNKISSLNISYEDLEEDIENLFNETQTIINNLSNKLNNSHVYNFIEHPIGFEKNKVNSYLF